MFGAIISLAQRIKVGLSAFLEPLAHEGNSFLGNNHGARRATMYSRSVQAPVTGSSLADKRQRGASLACPCVHGAMCARAHFFYHVSAFIWKPGSQQQKPRAMTSYLDSSVCSECVVCSLKLSLHVLPSNPWKDGRSLPALTKNRRSKQRALHPTEARANSTPGIYVTPALDLQSCIEQWELIQKMFGSSVVLF